MTADIGLGLAVVCAGLWSGLLLTLTTILHPIYAAEDGRWPCATSCPSRGGRRPTTCW